MFSSILSRWNGLPTATTSERDLVRAVLKTKRSQMLLVLLMGSPFSVVGSIVEMKMARNSVPIILLAVMNNFVSLIPKFTLNFVSFQYINYTANFQTFNFIFH